MSAVFLSLLLVLIVLSAAVLLHLRALARKLDTAARPAPQFDEALIRRAVAEALAADREREITEARAFWAEQEARAAEDSPLFDTPFTTVGEDWPIFFPRPTGPQEAVDNGGVMDPEFGEALRSALEDLIKEGPVDGGSAAPGHDGPRHPAQGGGFPVPADGGGFPAPSDGGSFPAPAAGGDVRARREADLLATGLEAGLLDAEAEPAAAPDPRRHPSHPDFVPSPTPSREWTDDRLAALAEDCVALTDVRPGPLGTLDVYAFADGTTLCVAPGDREAAYRLIDAVRAGEDVRLLGGSRFSGSYSLTFSTDDEAVYVLADRVVASI
ncbi:hypothetical protein ACIQBJ_21710 [Kitasatospora sp. NPDC088391]|uniref:hypothetical protein n=1 Tax=Kitasatospora sp. NPDC088391 TaxID=3364074 RepID=UPI0038219C26